MADANGLIKKISSTGQWVVVPYDSPAILKAIVSGATDHIIYDIENSFVLDNGVLAVAYTGVYNNRPSWGYPLSPWNVTYTGTMWVAKAYYPSIVEFRNYSSSYLPPAPTAGWLEYDAENDEWVDVDAPFEFFSSPNAPASSTSDGDYIYDSDVNKWLKGTTHSIWKHIVWYMSNGTVTYMAPDNGLDTPPTSGWVYQIGGVDVATASLEVSYGDATWVSDYPTTGFVSLTDTPTEDFGYVITFDVQGGVPYPYYKYCTKTAGEVYGILPEAVRASFIFAGWYTDRDGQGTRITATDELLAAADATIYARWVKNVSGKVGCGACLVSLFALGIGTDLFCEYIGSRLAKTTPQTIVRKLPTP